MTRLVSTLRLLHHVRRHAERMGVDGSLTLRFLDEVACCDLGSGKGPVRLLVAVSDGTENEGGK